VHAVPAATLEHLVEVVHRLLALGSYLTACMLARLALSMRAVHMPVAAHSGSLREVHADEVRSLRNSNTKDLGLRYISTKADRFEGFVGVGNTILRA
jgi:hypothetical protein